MIRRLLSYSVCSDSAFDASSPHPHLLARSRENDGAVELAGRRLAVAETRDKPRIPDPPSLAPGPSILRPVAFLFPCSQHQEPLAIVRDSIGAAVVLLEKINPGPVKFLPARP